MGGGMTSGAGTSGMGGASSGGVPGLNGIVPLYDATMKQEPSVVEDTPTALITRLADRARDRHARESQFQAYEHYLHIYWEHRTAQLEIVDTVGRGGDSITFNVETQWKLDDKQAELRFFFRGIGTVAEYHDNQPMTRIDDLHYTRSVSRNAKENRELRVGDKMEFELSQFLDSPPRGRDNYYGTTMLYIVGKGIVPWAGTGELRDSEAIPEEAWLGGHTTVHRNESDEPDNHFLQMAGNLAPQNGQRFVLGRRAGHTHFGNGSHDESKDNPVWQEQAGKLGPLSINHSCNSCHPQNGRAVPPAIGVPLDQFVIKVGDADGKPEPLLGGVLQPSGDGEFGVRIASWTEANGLRTPTFAFSGETPTHFSPRIAPQLVGMGLLEAIPEAAIAALADPDDSNDDGVSGRMRVLTDPVTGDQRLGRFGWKAGQASVRHQVAAALRTDMGVTTSVFPTPDCGAAQTGCGDSGPELADAELDNLALYISLLGIRPQRDWDRAEVVKGEELFETVGCANCHAAKFETSALHPFAELRAQSIRPYTDLLLHDMGPGLADTLAEGDATYLEWRTPPLWGIGFTAGISRSEGYLHDGRARTLSEAILWHGGEGEPSKVAFTALPQADKNALLTFVKSL